MTTRTHVEEIELAASPEGVFDLLVRPSAIRAWWSAARAIVVPEPGGLWAAAWGDDEDDPDYVSIARLAVYEPPRRLAFADYRYRSKFGPLPFAADFTTEFTVRPAPGGRAVLHVEQAGFPAGPEADEFYAACQKGWRDTFAGIERFLAVGGR